MSYGVRVERQRLRFMAAHMATWAGGCEPLHGHNYQLIVEVEGDLTADAWVIDFSLLKRVARERCDAIDHTFLLQRASTVLRIREEAGRWLLATPAGKEYAFPKDDVSVLPIDNTTAERLAEWLHGELAAALVAEGAGNIRHLRVEVEEAPGQAGWHAASLTPSE
jgi:6-pyruvoyltetrahydropterin/6-carboxytetrahydropterin synthase